MKLAIGLVLAVCVGIGCRWFGIPLPGPPAIMGAAMAVAMASGYTLTDYLLTRKTESTSSLVRLSSVDDDQSSQAQANSAARPMSSTRHTRTEDALSSRRINS